MEELPQFQHKDFTYWGARLLHWLVLKQDIKRVMSYDFDKCRDVTCHRDNQNGDMTEVRRQEESISSTVILPRSLLSTFLQRWQRGLKLIGLRMI